MNHGTDCQTCTFIVSTNHIEVTPLQELKAQFSIVELGYFTMPNWSGHSMFYLFKCPHCGDLQRSYVHGFDAHLVCYDCQGDYYVSGKRFYENDGRVSPPSFWQQLKFLFELRKRMKDADRLKAQVSIHTDGAPIKS